MTIKRVVFFLGILLSFYTYAQENYSVFNLKQDLIKDANSVVLFESTKIEISSIKKYEQITKRAVVVLNEKGLNNLNVSEYYSESKQLKSINAIVYDAFGKEIKKFKEKDFDDNSVADGFSILTSGRIKSLNYIPLKYPFTMVFESTIESENTAFLPSWDPVNHYYESVLFSEFIISSPKELGFQKREMNLEKFAIEKEQEGNTYKYKLKDFYAEKPEEYSNIMFDSMPEVSFALENFALEGVEGKATSWKEFGQVWYKELIDDDSKLSEKTVNDITALTNNVTGPIDKAKLVYQYMQNKTRYVSIQLGIGGWKPMRASEVDRLGYGDCKALTNYTRVLLDKVGVPSYYVQVFAGDYKKDIKDNLVSQQGNHAILAIPNDSNYVFLECTSQIAPFGYVGNFTDGRKVILIKPSGGEVVTTVSSTRDENLQEIKGKVKIDAKANFVADLSINSKGIQYDYRSGIFNETDVDKQKVYYKEQLSWINGLKIEDVKFENQKSSIRFNEILKLQSENYCTKMGNDIIVPINAFNRLTSIPKKYRNRKYGFSVQRGYKDIDEVEYEIAETLEISFLPEAISIETKFGNYYVTVVKNENNKILFKRILEINEGDFSKDDYEEFRKFREEVARNDNAKIILKTI